MAFMFSLILFCFWGDIQLESNGKSQLQYVIHTVFFYLLFMILIIPINVKAPGYRSRRGLFTQSVNSAPPKNTSLMSQSV